ncbi:ATP-dependent RNA helicase dbp2, partial [Bonamia ostreae]
SATWPQEVESLASDFVNAPLKVRIGSLETSAVHSVTQNVLVVDRRDKFNILMEDIVPGELSKGGQVLVFVSTRRVSMFLFGQVEEAGGKAVLIHGGKTQLEREEALDDFSKGRCPVMIATDVLQRGLDIPRVTCVVNYDFPQQIEVLTIFLFWLNF